jgi:hypothetical protein
VATPDDTNLKHAMRGMAYFRIGLGAFAWLAPRMVNCDEFPRRRRSQFVIKQRPTHRGYDRTGVAELDRRR